MSSVDSLISNVKNYADEASAFARSCIEMLDDIAQNVADIGIARGIQELPYRGLDTSVKHMESDLQYMAMPEKPSNLGTFEQLEDPSMLLNNQRQSNYSEIISNLQSLISELQSLPDRFSEASALFDTIGNTVVDRILQSEVPVDEVNAEFEIHLLEAENVLDETYEDILSKFAAYGHRFMPSEVVRTAERAAKSKARELSKVNRDITRTYAHTAATTSEFYFSKAVEAAAEQLKIGKERYISAVEAAKLLARTVRAEQDQNNADFNMWELKLSKDKAYQSVLMAMYKDHISAWASQFDLLTRYYAVALQADADKIAASQLLSSVSKEQQQNILATIKMQLEIASHAISGKLQVISEKVAGSLASLHTLAGKITEIIED